MARRLSFCSVKASRFSGSLPSVKEAVQMQIKTTSAAKSTYARLFFTHTSRFTVTPDLLYLYDSDS
jgi:hypothetical protein